MTTKPEKRSILGAPPPGKRGRKPKYSDPLHLRQREASRRYYWRKKWREATPSKNDEQDREEPKEVTEKK